MRVNLERLVALAALLTQPDERSLRGRISGRGHRLTQPGSRDRLAHHWLPLVDVWTEHRIAASVGSLEGWKPARRIRPFARFGR